MCIYIYTHTYTHHIKSLLSCPFTFSPPPFLALAPLYLSRAALCLFTVLLLTLPELCTPIVLLLCLPCLQSSGAVRSASQGLDSYGEAVLDNPLVRSKVTFELGHTQAVLLNGLDLIYY